VELNKYIQLGCVPNPKWRDSLDYPYPGMVAFVMGWGTLNQGGQTPKLLQNTRITIYNSSLCLNVVPDNVKNWRSQICAGKN
jgi:hypothetical protein